MWKTATAPPVLALSCSRLSVSLDAIIVDLDTLISMLYIRLINAAAITKPANNGISSTYTSEDYEALVPIVRSFTPSWSRDFSVQRSQVSIPSQGNMMMGAAILVMYESLNGRMTLG
jgi:hypothetical protein